MRCKKKVNSLTMVVLVHNGVYQINDNVEFFEYLDNIEEGLNLTEQTDAYMSENENFSEHENLINNV